MKTWFAEASETAKGAKIGYDPLLITAGLQKDKTS